VPKSPHGKHRPPKNAKKESKASRDRAWRDAWRKAYQEALDEDENLRLAIAAEEDEARAWHDAELTRRGRHDAGGAFIVPMKLIAEYLCRRFDAHARWNRLYVFREEQLDEWEEFLSWLKADLLANYLETLSPQARQRSQSWWKVDSMLEGRVAHWRAQGAWRVLAKSEAPEPQAPADSVKCPQEQPSPAEPTRMRGTVTSPSAARKMEAHLEAKGIGVTDFATRAGTTDRTLRSFRKTGKVRRDIFDNIAEQMGTTKEELLKD
jgi:hypothetical protein